MSILISEILVVTKKLGLKNKAPVVLGDAGNLIVHLAPYPIVARVAKLFDGDDSDFWHEIWSCEVKVAKHLMEQGVPAIPCSNLLPPGPHKVADTWMTLWEYIEPVSLTPLNGEQAINMVNDLSRAMSNFKEPLRPLRAWWNVNRAADYLYSLKDDDHRILNLLSDYEPVNERIQGESLYPAHGDAHRNNLVPSSAGWRWSDFEDVSLMPKFWDLASFIANAALFAGLEHPLVQYVLQDIVSHDRQAFAFALTARVIMAPMTNMALALQGHGDVDFAQAQLDHANDFLLTLKNGSLWS